MRCSCGDSRAYEDCCKPLHCGEAKAKTAEELMRSRYAAYVNGAIDYLVATTHPSNRAAHLREGYQKTYASIQWIGLEVLSSFQGLEADKTGKVEFRASYIQNGHTLVSLA